MNAAGYKWHPEVHVKGLDEKACQWIVAIEGLLDRFGVKTEAYNHELHQRLGESQTVQANLMKYLHELQQFAILKLRHARPALIRWIMRCKITVLRLHKS